MPLQIVFSFYLKHIKYPFCAPIFHPISEKESSGKNLKNKGVELEQSRYDIMKLTQLVGKILQDWQK